MSDVTLRDVLAMPVLRAAEPAVLAGADGLGRRVRWVHATELPDIAPLRKHACRPSCSITSMAARMPSTPCGAMSRTWPM